MVCIMIFTTLDHFRRESRKKEFRPIGEFTVFDTYGEADQSYKQEEIEARSNEDLYKVIKFLPEDQRKVSELRIFCNNSVKEIAEETDVSINTAVLLLTYVSSAISLKL